MYHLQLTKGSDAYSFLKFTANFFYNMFEGSSSGPEASASLIESLKIQMDLHSNDEVVHLQFDLDVLKHLTQLIAFLAQKKLEQNEELSVIALTTEQQTGIQIWNQYLAQTDLYFKELKSFIHEDEWIEIERLINK